MPTTQPVPVQDLVIDLSNFRTVRQTSELNAIKATIAISTPFRTLTESLATDGYLPKDTVIVLKSGTKLLVKEGNRRVEAMKILHGLVKTTDLGITPAVQSVVSAPSFSQVHGSILGRSNLRLLMESDGPKRFAPRR